MRGARLEQAAAPSGEVELTREEAERAGQEAAFLAEKVGLGGKESAFSASCVPGVLWRQHKLPLHHVQPGALVGLEENLQHAHFDTLVLGNGQAVAQDWAQFFQWLWGLH